MRYSDINPTTLFTDSKRVQTDVGRCNRRLEEIELSASGVPHLRAQRVVELGDKLAREWGKGSRPSVPYSRPIFMSSRGFDFETAS